MTDPLPNPGRSCITYPVVSGELTAAQALRMVRVLRGGNARRGGGVFGRRNEDQAFDQVGEDARAQLSRRATQAAPLCHQQEAATLQGPPGLTFLPACRARRSPERGPPRAGTPPSPRQTW